MRWILLPVFLLPLALANGGEPPQEEPKYEPPRYEEWHRHLLSGPNYRTEGLPTLEWPYVVVLREDRFRETQRAKAEGKAGLDHEWLLPMSTLQGTQEVARDLRKAWQRFEERYYWRAITELNNPAFWFAFCLAGLRGPDLNPPLPPFRLQVDFWSLPTPLADALKDVDFGRAGHERLFMLDRYLPIPQVGPREFCDGLGLQILPLMFIPGFKVLVFGHEIFRTPGYPGEPLWFNWYEANARVKRAMAHALKEYYKDYQAEVARILLTPRPQDLNSLQNLSLDSPLPSVYLPIPWQGHLLGGGSVVAPVFTEPVPMPNKAQEYTTWLEKTWKTYQSLSEKVARTPLEKVYAYVHFYRMADELFRNRLLLGFGPLQTFKDKIRQMVEVPIQTVGKGMPVLKGCFEGTESLVACVAKALFLEEQANDLAGKPVYHKVGEAPSFWRLEEIKRWFAPAPLLFHEAFGYTSLFQAYSVTELTVIPDYRKVTNFRIEEFFDPISRLIVYWHVPLVIDIGLHGVSVYPPPPLEGPIQPKGIPPYMLPYALPRVGWRWVSVPEGYEIPGVRGRPYHILSDLASFSPDLSRLYEPLLRGR